MAQFLPGGLIYEITGLHIVKSFVGVGTCSRFWDFFEEPIGTFVSAFQIFKTDVLNVIPLRACDCILEHVMLERPED